MCNSYLLFPPLICSTKHWVWDEWACSGLEGTCQGCSIPRVSRFVLKRAAEDQDILGFVDQIVKLRILYKLLAHGPYDTGQESDLPWRLPFAYLIEWLGLEESRRDRRRSDRETARLISVLRFSFKSQISVLLVILFFKSWGLLFHFMGPKQLGWLFIAFN